MSTTPSSDIAILTIKLEEFEAVRQRLKTRPWKGKGGEINLHAWETKRMNQPGGGKLDIVLGLVHDQTNGPAAMAAVNTFDKFRPRYFILTGICGSLHDSIVKGDIIVADSVWDYQYSRVTEDGLYIPRQKYRDLMDGPLRSSAATFARREGWWKPSADFPARFQSRPPVVHFGGIAAGNAVVENPKKSFFARVMKADPDLAGVEMESAGLALVVRSLRDAGHACSLLVVRGVSDEPCKSKPKGEGSPTNRQTRKRWTNYAAGNAAQFVSSFLKHAFPYSAVPEEPVRQFDPNWYESKKCQSHFIGQGELSTIHDINQEVFKPSDLISTRALEAWWFKNPFSIRIINSSRGESIGYWHVIFVDPQCFSKLCRGRLTERRIPLRCILGLHQVKRRAVYMYIGAVACWPKAYPAAAVLTDLAKFLILIHKKLGINGLCAFSVGTEAVAELKRLKMNYRRATPKYGVWVSKGKAAIDGSINEANKICRELARYVPTSDASATRDLLTLLNVK